MYVAECMSYWHLQRKVKRSAHPLKDELLFCFTELNETGPEKQGGYLKKAFSFS